MMPTNNMHAPYFVDRSSDASPLQVAVVDTDNSTCDVWINENMAAVARFVDSEDYRQLQSSHYVHNDDDADSASGAGVYPICRQFTRNS